MPRNSPPSVLWFRLRAITSALAFLVGIVSSRAAIIYSGLESIAIPTNFDGVYLDIQTGVTSTSEFAGWDFNPFFGGVGVANGPEFQPARTGTGNGDPIVRYAVGDTIGGGLLYSTDYGGSDSHLGGGFGQFGIGQEGYLAFRLITNGGLSNYYGWVRVVFTANTGGAMIKDWAYEDSGSPIVGGRVQQSTPSGGVQVTTFSPGAGESFTYGSLLGDPGGGNIGSLVKTGDGATVLTTDHSYTGATAISNGVLELAGGSLSGTANILVNAGGTLLFSGPGGVNSKLNGGASVTLDGGTISGANLTAVLDQQFGTLTLTQDSIIDFSLLAAGNTFRFANSSSSIWASAEVIKIFNYTVGKDHLFVGTSNLGLTLGQLNAIEFYSDNGVTLLNATAPQFIGSGELSPVAVPEPSGLLAAVSLITLAALREGRQRRMRGRNERVAAGVWPTDRMSGRLNP